ncbi:hypothetical protein [Streptomyces fuscigenes]|uniref:hypothetical protein n=1 Tax=Streptomyces fuscigenes TaxID=1528880 RepID=UPI001F20B847|nr:hypothetical protein [Streptomyces fuscigenes]MCF3961669.1 hypothetical protein [Streptomyces fuscigenes]
MTTTTSGPTAVSATALHTATERIIIRAAQDLWPDKEVTRGPQSPSVTSYVSQIRLGDERLMAKYSWLGMSLVSIMRGAGGSWQEVQTAQRAYADSGASVTAREAQNLEFLRTQVHPRVCDTAGLHRGVLFTRIATGTPLADELAARPWDTAALLDAALLTLGVLHDPPGTAQPRQVASIAERSVVGVFRRKFNGLSAGTYLRTLGRDSDLLEDERLEVVELLQTSVRRLIQMCSAISTRRDTLVFGDLKPEHVFIDGPRLQFIDPALQWAGGPQPDIAKLTGRALLLAIGHPKPHASQQIVEGVSSTLGRHMAGLPSHERAGRLRELMILWLMDTVSILSTCLNAPQGLPLAPHQQSLIRNSCAVARIVDRASALLIGSMAGPRLLDTVFSEVEHTARGVR